MIPTLRTNVSAQLYEYAAKNIYPNLTKRKGAEYMARVREAATVSSQGYTLNQDIKMIRTVFPLFCITMSQVNNFFVLANCRLGVNLSNWHMYYGNERHREALKFLHSLIKQSAAFHQLTPVWTSVIWLGHEGTLNRPPIENFVLLNQNKWGSLDINVRRVAPDSAEGQAMSVVLPSPQHACYCYVERG